MSTKYIFEDANIKRKKNWHPIVFMIVWGTSDLTVVVTCLIPKERFSKRQT